MKIIRDELKSLPAGRRELRNFGWVIGGLFVALGGWFLWSQKPAAPYFFAAGAPLILLGTLAPMALRRTYFAWMAIGLALGLVVSTALLILFFFLILTPIALAARLAGKDFMERRRDSSARSYWKSPSEPEKNAAHFERQF